MAKINYVVSYPKSGATWFRFLMYTLFHQRLENSVQVKEFYPEVGVDNDLITKKLGEEKNFFVKSHFSYSPDLDYIVSINHIIHLVRDPFNCMKSRLDYYRYNKVKWIDSKVRRLNYLDEFIEEADEPPHVTNDNMHGGWNYHTVSWSKELHNIPILIIRYEDMIENCEKVLKEVCSKLELPFNEKEITNAVQLSAFEQMKKLENQEMEKKQSGMFFGTNRENAFSEKENIRFVMKGKSRNFYSQLSLDQKIKGIEAFQEGLLLGGYDDIVSRLPYLINRKNELSNT